MKGFVPVTKASLFEMAKNCREEISRQEASERTECLDHYVSKEKARMETSPWYWPFTKRKARFAFDEESIKAYSAGKEYPMFYGDPFRYIKDDANNSQRWLDKIEHLAQSDYAGEPIQIDLKTFQRLSNPTRYYWVRAEGIYYTVN